MAATQPCAASEPGRESPAAGKGGADAPRLASARVLVVGMGKTGLATARFLASRRADVLLADTRGQAELGEKWAAAQRIGVATRAGLSDARSLGAFDLAVISPGLRLDAPPVAGVRADEVVSEIELASWFCPVPMVAVAGTNGKGTTSTLLGAMLRQAGRRIVVAGNIGSPLVENLEPIRTSDLVVVEVSSFQLEGTKRFRPRIALLLNITPDHLDYHPSLESYVAAKARLFRNQTDADHAVLNADDELVLQAAADARARRALFSMSERPPVGAFVAGGSIVLRTEAHAAPARVCPISDIPMPGNHNIANVLAAALAAALCDAPVDAIADAVRRYQPLEHVMERVGAVDGITFVNDTKATNEAAALAALDAVAGPVVLIAGGKDKGVDLSAFAARSAQRARAIYLIGETAPEIARHVRAAGGPSPVPCGSLEEAVRCAAEAAEPGDTVLLAPACSSHDMFLDYADRGRYFREAVRKLIAERRG